MQGGDEFGWDWLLFSCENNGNLFCSHSADRQEEEEEEVREIQQSIFIFRECDKRVFYHDDNRNAVLQRDRLTMQNVWVCADTRVSGRERA